MLMKHRLESVNDSNVKRCYRCWTIDITVLLFINILN